MFKPLQVPTKRLIYGLPKNFYRDTVLSYIIIYFNFIFLFRQKLGGYVENRLWF